MAGYCTYVVCLHLPMARENTAAHLCNIQPYCLLTHEIIYNIHLDLCGISLSHSYSIDVYCTIPKQLHDGTLSYDGTRYNMVVVYKCDEGYVLIGSSTRVCQSSGKWSGVEPFCERK